MCTYKFFFNFFLNAHTCRRNALLDGQPSPFKRGWRVPTAGILSVDFVKISKPDPKALTMSKGYFRALLSEISAEGTHKKYIYICINIYICTHLYICRYINIYANIYVYAYIYVMYIDICIYISKYIHPYIYIHIYIYVYMYMHVCICMYIYMYLCKYVYICIHV